MHTTRKAPLSLDRFEPVMPLAKAKVRELLARNARLTSVSRDQVQLVREGQLATIDVMGRVSWRALA